MSSTEVFFSREIFENESLARIRKFMESKQYHSGGGLNRGGVNKLFSLVFPEKGYVNRNLAWTQLTQRMPYFQVLAKVFAGQKVTVLGEGTTAFVLGGENSDLAIKILKKATKKEIEHEFEMQRMFFPHSPEALVMDHFPGGGGYIVMKRIDSTLDTYMSEDLKDGQLSEIRKQLTNILKFMWEKKIVHGDLALFNIGVCKEKLVLIDFDDAGNKQYDPMIDLARLCIEWNPSLTSEGTDKINENNQEWMLTQALHLWLSVGKKMLENTKVRPKLQKYKEEFIKICNQYFDKKGKIRHRQEEKQLQLSMDITKEIDNLWYHLYKEWKS